MREDVAKQRADSEADERPQHPLKREFGLPVPPFENDDDAPPIDEEALRALAECQLDAASARLIWGNVLRYRCWAAALCRLAVSKYLDRNAD